MRKRMLVALMTLVMMMTVAAGCGNSTADKDKTTPPPQQRSVVDMTGVEVKLPAEVNTVANCWPSSNQIMITLGATDKQPAYFSILKTQSFSWMQLVNPAITEKPAFGAGSAVTAEELLTLKPDLVITANANDAEAFRNAGLTTLCMMFNNYKGLKESVLKTGEALGGDATTRAQAYVGYLDGNIKMVQDRLADVPNESRPTVYYLDGQSGKTPYSTGGSGTMQEEWITMGGGQLATAELFQGMTKEITPEELIKLDPDYIVVGGLNQATAHKALMADTNLANLKAIKDGHVYRIPQGTFQWDRFGSESALQVVWMAKTLYPDKFADVDLKKMTVDFYKDYLDYDLSSEYADAILAGKNSPTGE
ncbi:MAG: ABC transporter substrate-binding protein [Syntrophomonadaceae bacterium]|nr:ABC transporter substrate-binding protein [Syntrophomonadaceae bacterium]